MKESLSDIPTSSRPVLKITFHNHTRMHRRHKHPREQRGTLLDRNVQYAALAFRTILSVFINQLFKTHTLIPDIPATPSTSPLFP